MSLKTNINWKRQGVFEFIIIDVLIAYIFYDSVISFFVFLMFMPIYLNRVKKQTIMKNKEVLLTQFCEMIESISTSLSAGLSVENSFYECRKEMERMYTNKSEIVHEIDEILAKLKINVPVWECLFAFSNRTDIEEIKDFAIVFSQAIKSGGNLREIISSTVSIIHDKTQVEAEIKSMLKGKMLEQKVMSIIPFIIVLYIRVFNGAFLSILYHNVAGVIVMTCCLIVYIVSFIISERIVNISV